MTDNPMKAALKQMLFKPNVILATGKPGAGKTHAMMVLCAFVLLNGGHVISNVRLQKWDKEKRRPFLAEYPNYYFARTLTGIMLAISEILYKDRSNKIFVYLDEGQNALDSLSFAGGLARNFKKFMSLIRKFNCSLGISTPRAAFLLKALREEEAGLLSVQLLKDPADIMRHGQDLLEQGYKPREILIVHWPSEGIHYKSAIVQIAPILAIPAAVAKDTGQVHFDTGGIASLTPGEHPLTKQPVNFEMMLAQLDDYISYDYPQYLYQFFHSRPVLPDVALDDLPDESVDSDVSVEPTAHGVKDSVDTFLLAGHRTGEIRERVKVSRQYIAERRKELRAEGKLA